MDKAIKLLGYEAIKLLGYKAIRLYGHTAVNTELHHQILNLVRKPCSAKPTSTFLKLPETIFTYYRYSYFLIDFTLVDYDADFTYIEKR